MAGKLKRFMLSIASLPLLYTALGCLRMPSTVLAASTMSSCEERDSTVSDAPAGRLLLQFFMTVA